MRIVVLTGAGISAESGLGTFRDVGGLWSRYDLAEVATPEGYARNPSLVLGFYNARRENAAAAAPNPAHRALGRLAAAPGTDLRLITQNIDDLHEQGGVADPLHMHGSLFESLCAACGDIRPHRGDMSVDDICDACGRAGAIRPNVVWFGEVPYRLDLCAEWIERSDLFVSIGTSGTVYPAAGFVALAEEAGVPTLELNLEASDAASPFDRIITGQASEIVPAWVESVTQVSRP